MAKVCNALGIDTWELSGAAGLNRSVMRFNPGPDRGHCIPLEPALSFVEGASNTVSIRNLLRSPNKLILDAEICCRTRARCLNERKIGERLENFNLGVAYKKDIDYMRESPALSVIDLLRSRGGGRSLFTMRLWPEVLSTTLTQSATASRFTIRPNMID